MSAAAQPNRGVMLARAAQALIGCPFRLHGRDPLTGLDCVGLVAAAMAASGLRPVAPTGYALRNLAIEHWLPLARLSGLAPAKGLHRSGDILLLRLGQCQHHLAIAAEEGIVIHAHAGLQQVVRQPLERTWLICAQWRVAPRTEG